MDTSFEIPLTYNSKEYSFPAEYISTGYTYKIIVNIFGQMISFEPDEERNFRALLNYDDISAADKIDKAMVEEIAMELVRLFKD